jgi:hypothetical protein
MDARPRRRALLAALAVSLGACGTSTDERRPVLPPATVVVAAPAPAPAPAPAAHGDKWADPEDPKTVGGFSMFKEAWVYVDGRPVGVLREAELPPLPAVWVDQVELLDFSPATPGPRERRYQVRRWRVADYLAAVGVPLRRVKTLLLHGGRGTAVIPGAQLRAARDEILFDLTGNNNLKLRVFLPDRFTRWINTSFDRYAAISVIVDKQAPVADENNTLELDGVELQGIPYYGQPLRGGIRVYLDGRLATVIKRNALGDAGRVQPGVDRWSLVGLLAAQGVDVSAVAAADLVDPRGVATRLGAAEVPGLSFSSSSQAQGAVLLSTGTTANAMLLWSRGRVPPPRGASVAERARP